MASLLRRRGAGVRGHRAAPQGDSAPLLLRRGLSAVEDPLSLRYDIRRHDFLGQGADGSVVRGVERATGQWHALKFLSRSGYDPQGEVKALQKVKHPNVIELL